MKKILWFTIIIATGCYMTGPIVDPDLWWHITVGKWILGHGAVPRVDYWNQFAAGDPWRAYSWLNEVLFAFTDRVGGIEGLLLLKLLIAISLVFSLFYCFGKVSGDWFVGACLGLLVAAASIMHFTLRPQTIVLVLFPWVFLVSHQISRDGFSKYRGLLLFILFCLWANSHLSVILPLSVVVVWTWEKDWNRGAFLSGLCAIAGTLFTPWFWGVWTTFFAKAGHPFDHRAIAEFSSATIMQYSTGFLLLLTVLLVVCFHYRPLLQVPSRLFLAIFFLLGSLAVVKFQPFTAVLLGFLIAEYRSKESLKSFGNIGEGVSRLKELFVRIPERGLAFVCIALAIVEAQGVLAKPLNTSVVPEAAIDFFELKKLPFPLLNEFGRGGYVMYRLSDENGNLEHKVSIDGRTNVVPEKIWKKHLASLRGHHNWRDYIHEVNPQTILWRTESPFASLLIASGEWCSVFRLGDLNKGHQLFVKKSWLEANPSSLDISDCH